MNHNVILCEVVENPEGILSRNAQLKHRRVTRSIQIRNIDEDVERSFEMPVSPLKMDGISVKMSPGPVLGEHSHEILSKL